MSFEKLQIYGCLWSGWHTTYILQLAQNDQPSSGQSVKIILVKNFIQDVGLAILPFPQVA